MCNTLYVAVILQDNVEVLWFDLGHQFPGQTTSHYGVGVLGIFISYVLQDCFEAFWITRVIVSSFLQLIQLPQKSVRRYKYSPLSSKIHLEIMLKHRTIFHFKLVIFQCVFYQVKTFGDNAETQNLIYFIYLKLVTFYYVSNKV